MSTTTTNPNLIYDTDLKFYFSGGYHNADPNQSIGGEISSFALTSGLLNGLFDRVDTAEAIEGDIEYRCIYLRNNHQTRKLLGTKIWVETETKSADTWIRVSIGSSGMNGIEPMLPSEGIEPPMNFFDIPYNQPEEPNIGDLYPGDHIAIWVRWFVKTGTLTEADDFAVLRVDGEREPESLQSTIPPGGCPAGSHLDTTTNQCVPNTPPVGGCPAGTNYDPVSDTCVPGTQPIVCPLGWVYDNVTQRCKQTTTNPPSVATFKFAVAGDFSCTSDNTASMNSMKQRLNLEAGPDQSLFIANGDLSYGSTQNCWIDSTKALGAMFPGAIAPTIGNHDDTEDGNSQVRGQVMSAYPLIPSEGWYALTRRNIRFIFMDTQRSYSVGSAQHTFVKTQLDAAKADPAIKWVVVSYHKPSINSDSSHAALTDLRNIYHVMFEANGKVVLVNFGHNHIYWRSKPCKHNPASPAVPSVIPEYNATGTGQNYQNMLGSGHVIYCINGTGGRTSNHSFGSTIPTYCAFRSRPAPYGVLFVTLEDNGNRLACEYITNSGQVLDSFQISSTGATTPPGTTPQCPSGYTWNETTGRCVPNNAFPVSNVEWYYDAVSVLSANTNFTSGTHASDGILLPSTASSADSHKTLDGWLYIDSGQLPGGGRVYFDYHKRPRWAVDDQPGFNIAMTFTFLYEGQQSVAWRDGNHETTGFQFASTLRFGGFGFTLFPTQIESSVEYYHELMGTSISSVYPGNRTLVTGQTYKVFCTLRTNRTSEIVVLNVWMDFGNTGTWVKIMTDRTWAKSGWTPGTAVPVSDDRAQVMQGPSYIKRHHAYIRNNNGAGADLKAKDIRIGTLPFLPEGTTQPPPNNPPTDPPPPTTGADVIWDSNIDGKWNNGVARTVDDSEGDQTDCGKGFYTAASGDPRLHIRGNGIATLEADGGHGRIYVKACNFNAMIVGELKFNTSSIDNTTWKLRNRHDSGGDCENRFGGVGGVLERTGAVEVKIEKCHNEHESGTNESLPRAITVGQWVGFAFVCCNTSDNRGIYQNVQIDYKDGQGFKTYLETVFTNPPAYYMDEPTFMGESSFWIRINNESTGSVDYRNVQLRKMLAGQKGILSGTGGGTTTAPPSSPSATTGIDIQKALNFIKNQYRSATQMVEEAPGFNVYWLWNDQLLAQIALKHVDPTLAQVIEDKMNSFGLTMKTPWATLDPQYRSNFSVNGASEPTVSTNPLIRYSHYGDTGITLPVTSFADIAFLSAIHYYKTGNMTLARQAYDAGKAMWDGSGMKDGGNITGDYAIYKVALGVLAEKITGFLPKIGIPENYFGRFQAANGGITTDLTNGVPQGSQNVETTAAVIFALNPSLLPLG